MLFVPAFSLLVWTLFDSWSGMVSHLYRLSWLFFVTGWLLGLIVFVNYVNFLFWLCIWPSGATLVFCIRLIIQLVMSNNACLSICMIFNIQLIFFVVFAFLLFNFLILEFEIDIWRLVLILSGLLSDYLWVSLIAWRYFDHLVFEALKVEFVCGEVLLLLGLVAHSNRYTTN